MSVCFCRANGDGATIVTAPGASSVEPVDAARCVASAKTRGAAIFCLALATAAFGQQAGPHDHASVVKKPRVYLDKSPRIVEYQLKRLSNSQLLLVDRATDDPKYVPVFRAILLRPGMSFDHRESALAGITSIRGTAEVEELLSAIGALNLDDPNQSLVFRQLMTMLLDDVESHTSNEQAALRTAAESSKRETCVAGLAGIMVGGDGEAAWQLGVTDHSKQLAFLEAVAYLPREAQRTELRSRVVASLDESHSIAIRRVAVRALASMPASATANFEAVAPLVEDARLRAAAIETLLQTPKQDWPRKGALQLLRHLVARLESIPPAARTSDEELDGLQLADDLLALVSVREARPLRRRLRDVTVRVVKVNTVHEEMRYDKAYFVVEAGRPVQVVLKNEDAMPHNLVITRPGAMREIAQQAAGMGTTPGPSGKQYVPPSDKVLFATGMVQPGQIDRLVFDAPPEPGEYPFVCTFPRHWMRMYGVMVVTKDINAWLAAPQEPADPLGNTRSFVRNWTLDDLGDLAQGLRGRHAEIGAKLFKEATCAQCHRMGREGGAVGPELTDVAQRWKGDYRAILREILDPSYKVEPKFAMQTVITGEGKVLSGVVTAQDAKTLTLVTNPENPQPVQIARDEVDEIIQSTTSLMPKGLLDRFTRDEILELLAYVCGGVKED